MKITLSGVLGVSAAIGAGFVFYGLWRARENVGDAIDTVSDAVSGAVDTVKEAAGAVADTAGRAVDTAQDAGGFIVERVTSPFDTAFDLGQDAGLAVRGFAGRVAQEAGKLYDSFAETLTGKFRQVSNSSLFNVFKD